VEFDGLKLIAVEKQLQAVEQQAQPTQQLRQSKRKNSAHSYI